MLFSFVRLGNLYLLHASYCCHWVFTVKYRLDDRVDRYKTRLVARGFTQTYGLNSLKISSHVARLISIRVLFSLAVNRQWQILQLDVMNAFLYVTTMRKSIWSTFLGLFALGENKVCKLKKAIYGLKQSKRVV